MPNIFLQEIYFLAVDEYKETTTTSLSDENIQGIIYKAETSLKNYIWYDIEKTNDNSQDLKEATFYISKQIEKNKDLFVSANPNWKVKSESAGDRSYSFWDITSSDLLRINWINEQAKNILDKYKKIFYKQVL